jgi:transcriptional regulator with XRE-family HTH domain
MAKPPSQEALARAQRIRQARLAIGLTGTALGKRIGSTRQYVAALEAGRVSGRGKLHQLAKALRLDVTWLTTGAGPAPAWAAHPVTISRKEPFAEALTLLGTVMRSVSEEGKRRDVKVDDALASLETARMAIERL